MNNVNNVVDQNVNNVVDQNVVAVGGDTSAVVQGSDPELMVLEDSGGTGLAQPSCVVQEVGEVY